MKKSKFPCNDCAKDVYKTDGVFMLRDSIWNSVFFTQKKLVVYCLFRKSSWDISKTFRL